MFYDSHLLLTQAVVVWLCPDLGNIYFESDTPRLENIVMSV